GREEADSIDTAPKMSRETAAALIELIAKSIPEQTEAFRHVRDCIFEFTEADGQKTEDEDPDPQESVATPRMTGHDPDPHLRASQDRKAMDSAQKAQKTL